MIHDISNTSAPGDPLDRYPRPPASDSQAYAVPLSQCSIKRDGPYFLLLNGIYLINCEHDDRREPGYDYLRQALDILAPGRAGEGDDWPLANLPAWKTASFLATLRQGLRENRAQGMGLTVPKPGASEKVLRNWLSKARVLDAQHHGGNTF